MSIKLSCFRSPTRGGAPFGSHCRYSVSCPYQWSSLQPRQRKRIQPFSISFLEVLDRHGHTVIGKTPDLCHMLKKRKNTPQLPDRPRKDFDRSYESFPSYVCDTSVARVTGCVYPREAYSLVTPLLTPRSTGLRRSALFCTRKLYHPHSGGQSHISVEFRMHKTIIFDVTVYIYKLCRIYDVQFRPSAHEVDSSNQTDPTNNFDQYP